MAGITIVTMLIIRTRDDLEYTFDGPDKQGKFSGWIYIKNGRPLVSTDAIYDSAELAVNAMLNIKKKIDIGFDPVKFIDDRVLH